MSIKKKIGFIVCVCIMICTVSLVAFKSFQKANADNIRCVVAEKDVSYTIKSNGGSFWFSMSSVGNEYERARLSIALFDLINKNIDEQASVSAFSATEADCKDNKIKNFSQLSNDQRKFLLSNNSVYNFILIKNSQSFEMLYRKGAVSYINSTSSKLSDNEVYGLYFSNVKTEFSFLVNYLSDSNITFYYDENVECEICREQISPNINYENVELYTSSGILHSVFNRKISFIPFIINKPISDKEIIDFNGIYINGEKLSESNIVNDTVNYMIYKLKDGDNVNFSTAKFSVDYDYNNVQVHNLYEIAGCKEIAFNGLHQTSPIGNIPNKVDNAVTFKLHAPVSWTAGKASRFGLFTNNYMLWSNFGYIFTFYQDTVEIKSGEEVLLSSGKCQTLKGNSINMVEIGITKGYVEGVYRFNRIYAKVGGELVVYYDEFDKRGSLGSAFVGPPLDYLDAACSISDVRDYFEIKDITQSNNIALDFDKYVQPNSTVRINIIEKEGCKLTNLYINDVDVTNLIKSDGNLKYVEVNISQDSNIRYEFTTNNYVSVSILEGANCSSNYEQKVLYNSNCEIKLFPRQGYFFESVLVNDVDYTDKLVCKDNVFVLSLPLLKADINVVLNMEEKEFAVKDGEHQNAEIVYAAKSIKSGKTLIFAVVLDNGYKISGIYVGPYKVKVNDDGTFYIENIYSDIEINIYTEKQN